MQLSPPSPPSHALQLAISEIATRNGGSIRGVDLRALGITPRQVDHLSAIGLLHRVRRDHFLVGHRSPSHAGDLLSKVNQAGDDAFVSATSAIHTWGFLPWIPRIIDLVVPKERRPIPGVRLRVRPGLISMGGTTRGELRILEPEFAVLAACDRVDEAGIRRILREGMVKQALSMDRLESIATSRIHGVRRFRAAFDAWLGGDNGSWSRYERDVDSQLAEDVLQGSVANAAITVVGETLHVDRVWFEERICSEYDGPPHDLPDQRRIDRIRSAALRADSWMLVRVHWKDFDRDPVGAVAPLEEVVRAARAGRRFPT